MKKQDLPNRRLSRIYAGILASVIRPFYKWKAKYRDMNSSQLKKVKELEEENSHLKRIYAELSMINDA